MTTTISAGLFAAFIATTGFSTQPPQTQPPPPQPPPAAQQSAQPATPAPGDITVTGCLKEAPASAADAATPVGTTGTAGATAAAGASAPGPRYILSDATMGPAAPAPDARAAAAASPAASASASPQTYRLIANASALTAHVGKKLELIGTLETNSSEAGASADASGPALRVKSGKIVAASCAP